MNPVMMYNKHERITIMTRHPYYTEEIKNELRANPFTHHVTDHQVFFTLAFKEFVLNEFKKPGMTSWKVFEKAGYRPGIFPKKAMANRVSRIIAESRSPGGLKAPKPVQEKPDAGKRRSQEMQALEHRVRVLEQQLEFLKKTRYLDLTGEMPPDDMS